MFPSLGAGELPPSRLDMGVSATGDSWEIFPTRTLTPQKYWGNSPVKTGPNGEYFTGESGEIISKNIFFVKMLIKVGHNTKLSFFHDVVASNLLQGRQNVADCKQSEADIYRSWTGHQDVTELAASSPHMGHLAASQSVLRHCLQTGCGRFRAGTALTHSSAQSSSDARRSLSLCPCWRSTWKTGI